MNAGIERKRTPIIEQWGKAHDHMMALPPETPNYTYAMWRDIRETLGVLAYVSEGRPDPVAELLLALLDRAKLRKLVEEELSIAQKQGRILFANETRWWGDYAKAEFALGARLMHVEAALLNEARVKL